MMSGLSHQRALGRLGQMTHSLYCHISLCWLHCTLFYLLTGAHTTPDFLLLDHIFLHISTGGLGVRPAGRGLSLCDVTNLSPAAYRKFSCGGSRPSDARCSTPVPSRKRRCTMVVDYKEPTLNA